MPVYSVKTSRHQTIVFARNKNSAMKIVGDDVGRNNITSCEVAAAEDISWVVAMGGRIPPQAQRILDREAKKWKKQ